MHNNNALSTREIIERHFVRSMNSLCRKLSGKVDDDVLKELLNSINNTVKQLSLPDDMPIDTGIDKLYFKTSSGLYPIRKFLFDVNKDNHYNTITMFFDSDAIARDVVQHMRKFSDFSILKDTFEKEKMVRVLSASRPEQNGVTSLGNYVIATFRTSDTYVNSDSKTGARIVCYFRKVYGEFPHSMANSSKMVEVNNIEELLHNKNRKSLSYSKDLYVIAEKKNYFIDAIIFVKEVDSLYIVIAFESDNAAMRVYESICNQKGDLLNIFCKDSLEPPMTVSMYKDGTITNSGRRVKMRISYNNTYVNVAAKYGPRLHELMESAFRGKNLEIPESPLL